MPDPQPPVGEEELAEIAIRTQQKATTTEGQRLRRDAQRLLAEVYRLRALLGNRAHWLK
jgi:hypothetical protein